MKTFLFKIAKAPFFWRFMIPWISPLDHHAKKEWNSFTVVSGSGALISGLWAKAKGDHKGTIVLGHPMGKEAKGYFLKHGYADLYRDIGMNVVIFDINGFGESSHGDFSYYKDILAVGDFARAQFPAFPVGYHGISMGAQWSIISFTEDHPFQFAIIESAPTTLQEFWINYPVAFGTLKMFSWLMPSFTKKVSMIDRAGEMKGLNSILLIYSKADEYTTVGMGERFLSQSSVPAELWILETAAHARIMKSEERKKYKEKLTEFVKKNISA